MTEKQTQVHVSLEEFQRDIGKYVDMAAKKDIIITQNGNCSFKLTGIEETPPEDEERLIPHIHRCELELCRPKRWQEDCPVLGKLSETEEECDSCKHFVIIDFDPDNPLCMTKIIRNNP